MFCISTFCWGQFLHVPDKATNHAKNTHAWTELSHVSNQHASDEQNTGQIKDMEYSLMLMLTTCTANFEDFALFKTNLIVLLISGMFCTLLFNPATRSHKPVYWTCFSLKNGESCVKTDI